MKFNIWLFFRKSVDRIQVSLKYDKNNGHFMWIPVYFYDDNSFIFSQNEKRFRRNLQTKSKLVLYHHHFSPNENRVVYDIRGKKMVQLDRPQMIIPRMGIPYRINKATYTRTQNMYTYCFPTAIMVTRTRLEATFIRTSPVLLCAWTCCMSMIGKCWVGVMNVS
jgi:hypothetical protein